MTPTPTDIPISGETIRLGQLLKLAGVVDTAARPSALLAAAPAVVNGEPEARRGRQLRAGDTVRFGDAEVRVVQATPPAAGPSPSPATAAHAAHRPARRDPPSN